MAATLSRCNFVIQNDGPEAAKHDILITKLLMQQTSRKVLDNLETAKNISSSELDLINDIATTVCDNQGMIQKHPVEI
jgi:hypothetical protein